MYIKPNPGPPKEGGLVTKSSLPPDKAVVQPTLFEVELDDEQLQHADSSTSIDQVMLTTVDNPFDPFTEFDEWLAFDEAFGYYSNSLLARVMVSSESLSVSEQEEDYERAIDEIVRENLSGKHKKVYRNSSTTGDDVVL